MAFVVFDDLLAQSKPDACALILCSCIQPLEDGKHPLVEVRFEADTVILEQKLAVLLVLESCLQFLLTRALSTTFSNRRLFRR